VTPVDALVAYGQAMAKVQALEQLMRVALGEHEVRKALRKGENRVDPKLGAAMINHDFGKLEQRICGKFKLDAEGRQIMSDARGLRNGLAHSFWIHHQGHLATERGIATVIRHANLFSRQMDRVAGFVIEKTGVNRDRYANYITAAANDPATLEIWEGMLSDAEAVFDRTEPLALDPQ
jgi:hypothetical protein